MKLNIDKRRRYLLVTGAVLLAAAAVYRFAPSLDGLGAGEEIALQEHRLRKSRRVLREREPLRKEVKALVRELRRAESGLLSGKTPSLAAVDIQNMLNKMAEESRIAIKTVRVLKFEESEDNGYLIIPVQFTIDSTVRQLKELLYRIEIAPKYLTVQKVRVNVTRRRGRQQMVNSDITVSGLMKK